MSNENTAPDLPPLPDFSAYTDSFRHELEHHCRAYARAALAAQQPAGIPQGWNLVPCELTPEMRAAWDKAPHSEDDDADMRSAYRAMLAATPAAPAMRIPSTPADVRAFIGPHFTAQSWGNPYGQPPHENDHYEVSAHDLLSAFSDWHEAEAAHVAQGPAGCLHRGKCVADSAGRCLACGVVTVSTAAAPAAEPRKPLSDQVADTWPDRRHTLDEIVRRLKEMGA